MLLAGPSAVTLLGLGAVVVAGAAVFANKQEEGDLPNVSAAANGDRPFSVL